MDARVTADENGATFVEAQGGRARHDCAAESWFAHLVKALWPVKGPAAVAQYTRCPDRTARAYSSGNRMASATVLRDLLRGDEGYRVLTWIMVGFSPTWWLVIQRERELAALARDIFNQLDTVMK